MTVLFILELVTVIIIWTKHQHFFHFFSDNEFELLSPKIGNLINLRILAIRDNELIEVPEEIGFLTNLRELHLQGNRLTVLPPQMGK